MTGKITPVWDRIPHGRHFGTVLEIGAGYGRIPLYLARERDVTWSTYCAVDISETMLRAVHRVPRALRAGAESPLYLLCASADGLPLQDESVDTRADERRLPAHGQELRRARRRRDRARAEAWRPIRLRRLVPERAQPAELCSCRRSRSGCARRTT